ncbi:MAG: hypothetical protein ABIZ49_03585 [Opitutaceae bacterium]
MDHSLDLSRWRELPRGVGYRRWTIVSAGLRQLLRTRFFRILLAVAWMGGMAIAVLGFAFSQTLAPDGWVQNLAAFGPRAKALASALNAFVLLFPDLLVDGVFTLLFWLHSFLGLWLSLVALTVLVPQLITRDRASNALTVYLSRPLTTSDYLLGKLGIIVGVLALVWTGPLVGGWLLSMVFASDRDFIVYSFTPLLRALLFNGIALVALAAIALGISALGRASRVTTMIWLFLWLMVGFGALPPRAPNWMKRASFTHDLSQVRQEVFRVDTVFANAAAKLPLLDAQQTKKLSSAATKTAAKDFQGALVALGVFCALSSFVFFRKLKPE